MKSSTFLLFAALATISIIDVRARPAGSKQPEESSSWLGKTPFGLANTAWDVGSFAMKSAGNVGKYVGGTGLTTVKDAGQVVGSSGWNAVKGVGQYVGDTGLTTVSNVGKYVGDTGLTTVSNVGRYVGDTGFAAVKDAGQVVGNTGYQALTGVGNYAFTVGSAAVEGATYLANALMSFDPAAIRNVLGSVNMNTQFSDVFTNLLTELKKKDLNPSNAEGFVERMSLLAVESTFSPYLKIFRAIVKVYGMFENSGDLMEKALQELVLKGFDTMVKEYTKRDNHVMTMKIAPLITKLIESKGENAHGVAKEVVTILLSDPEVIKEVGELFIGATPVIGPAYSFVMTALQSESLKSSAETQQSQSNAEPK